MQQTICLKYILLKKKEKIFYKKKKKKIDKIQYYWLKDEKFRNWKKDSKGLNCSL